MAVVATSATAAAGGRLVLDPHGPTPIRGGRPIIDAEVLRRLTEGRRAAMLPDLLAALFALCGGVHRITARRAVAAALGLPEAEAEASRTGLALRIATLRDQLQRLVLDLPARVPVGVEATPAWLAGAPVVATPPVGSPTAQDLMGCLQHMSAWIERHLLGVAPLKWWGEWQASPDRTVARWASGHAREAHPVARWHAAVRERAESLRLPCRPLALLDAEPARVHAAMRDLARELDEDAGFATRPLWLGLPAETGSWTRCVAAPGASAVAGLDRADTAWLRLGARIADVARLPCDEQALRHGALALGAGEGIAWSEMARGLLVHWVRLEPGNDEPALARVQACRVLAPTEWNFHPDGGLAQWMRKGAPSAADVALAAAALDPCVGFEIEAGERDTATCGVGHA
ncbi:MAG: hydrogenase formation protein [Pseudomonadota bacterium]|jgi:hypothetical protein